MSLIPNSKPYAVIRNDNFAPPDDNVPLHFLNSFDTYQEAVEFCKRDITAELKEMYQPGMKADDLYKMYTGFGETPIIVSVVAKMPDEDKFDWETYEKEMCNAICARKEHELPKL